MHSNLLFVTPKNDKVKFLFILTSYSFLGAMLLDSLHFAKVLSSDYLQTCNAAKILQPTRSIARNQMSLYRTGSKQFFTVCYFEESKAMIEVSSVQM